MARNPNPETETGTLGFGQPSARITRKGRVGEIAAWCIAGIAWAISYGTQVALAVAHGFHGPSDWEAVGMGALTDLASLACMMLALDQAERGKSSRLSWLLSIAAAGMMEWANIVYAGRDPVAIILHAWPPALAVSIVFLLVHVRRTNATEEAEPKPFRIPEVSADAPEWLPELIARIEDVQPKLVAPDQEVQPATSRNPWAELAAELQPEPGWDLAADVAPKEDPESDPDPEPEPPKAPVPEPELPADVAAETELTTATPPEPNGHQAVTREPITLARARKAYRKLSAKGSVSGEALGRELGVSGVSGRKWKQRVEEAEPPQPFRPEVVA